MKLSKSRLLASTVTELAALTFMGSAFAADVTVNLSDVRAGGTLYVGLQTEDIFLQNEGVGGKIIKDVSAGDISVTISDVAPGQYSVSVWHDLDDDAVFDRMENGMPLDGWAMHNGRTLMGPPTWEVVSFEVTTSGFEVSETMSYPAE